MDKITPPPMPEPFWHVVLSKTAPIIDKAIRRRDVAYEHAVKLEEQYGHAVDIEVKELVAADQLAARDAQWLAIVKEAVLAERERMNNHAVILADTAMYAEREACAATCEGRALADGRMNEWDAAAKVCAAAIRSRSNHG